jgi:hypothetical protein
MQMFKRKSVSAAVLAAVLAFGAAAADAGAIRDAALFTDNTLPRNDDSSTGLVGIGFNIDFYGITRNQLYVNNNGNVTLNTSLGTFTPFGLLTSSIPIIAPFFADVDTRNTTSGVTQYGQDIINGRPVFGVNWINVGYFSRGVNKLNSFQLILTDRSDIATGDFDFEFNYDQIQWEVHRGLLWSRL